MTDAVAERIATLGGTPIGTPGHVVVSRTWDDYSIGRAGTQEHLAALDVVLTGVIADHRAAMQALDDLDLVTQDMLIGQLNELEKIQWFVRAHLQDSEGRLATAGATTEKGAAARV
jgi:starvation-inducible DNA-binding protein